MALILRYRLPNGSLASIAPERGESVVLGRDAQHADLVIEDKQTSRAHCCLSHTDGDMLLVEDLGSSNGTWITGERISHAKILSAGDVLVIGGTEFRVEEAPHDVRDPLVGRCFRDVEIIEVLGRGACGVVYRGLQTNLGREVAIKMLLPRLAESSKRREAFMCEARNAGRLTHPNLIQVHDVFECEGAHLMVMEYAEGGSVADAIQAEGPFNVSEALKMLMDAAAALAYAHSQGLVHRDVKPANILIVGTDAFKLADLGIAAQMSDKGVAEQRRFAGSPAYLSPEQALGKAIDGRADIYSLGASMWHVLTGKPLYEGPAREVIKQQIHAPLPDLKHLVPGLPGPLLSLINRMLAKDPAARIAEASTVAEVAQQALEVRQGAGQTASGARRQRMARRTRSAGSRLRRPASGNGSGRRDRRRRR